MFLSQKYPGLIMCNILGYRQDSLYYNKKAYNLLIQAKAGLLLVIGIGPNQPAKIGILIMDIVVGMYIYN
jgi:itaconate CoA-transferase